MNKFKGWPVASFEKFMPLANVPFGDLPTFYQRLKTPKNGRSVLLVLYATVKTPNLYELEATFNP